MTNAGVAVMVTHRISANNYTRHRTLLWFPTEADQQAFLLFTSSSGNNRDEDLDQFASSVNLQKLVPRILQRPLSGVSSNEELPLGKGLLALKLLAQSPVCPWDMVRDEEDRDELLLPHIQVHQGSKWIQAKFQPTLWLFILTISTTMCEPIIVLIN